MNKWQFVYSKNIYKIYKGKRGIIMTINEVNGAGQPQNGYTKVKVKDKDTGKSFVIDFKNAKVRGNEAEWTIKDGKVLDKNGKEVKDNELEVTRYQAALIKAAAEGDGDGKVLDSNDLIGASYGEAAEKALQDVKSEYHVRKDTMNDPPALHGDADALEHGIIYANVENQKGERGRLEIEFEDADKRQATMPDNKAWYEFWK